MGLSAWSVQLNSAIEAIKSGDKVTGFRLLAEIVRAEPSNESAWIWLSECVDEVEKKEYCLRRALLINPDNLNTLNALSQLQEPVPISTKEIETTTLQEEGETVTSTPVDNLPNSADGSSLTQDSIEIVPDNFQAKALLKKHQVESISSPSILTRTRKLSEVDKRIFIALTGILVFSIILLGISFGINALGLQNQSTPAEEFPQALLSTELITDTVVVFTNTPEFIPTTTTTQTSTPEFKPTDTLIPTHTPIPSLAPTTPTITLVPATSLPRELSNCVPQNTTVQKGLVVQINDGDTLDVRLEDANIYRVKYIGIDAPEKDDPFYAEAVKVNSDLVFQKSVILINDVSDDDLYARLLRYVFVGDVFVNLELVRSGLAYAVSYPPDVACARIFALMQTEARNSRAGLWAATQISVTSPPEIVISKVNKVAEYVDIKNVGNSDADLSGWNLVSESGNEVCSLFGIIEAGEILRIWSDDPLSWGFNCAFGKKIWNDSESDPAVLYNPQGEEVSRK